MENGMQDLIARLEAADVGGQELNGLIFRMLADDPSGKDHWFMSCGELMTEDNADSVTTSLDSALALAERVLPGWKMHALQDQDGMYQHDNSARRWCCGLSEKRGPGNELSYSPTPALALCIAILRAKQIDTASNPR